MEYDDIYGYEESYNDHGYQYLLEGEGDPYQPGYYDDGVGDMGGVGVGIGGTPGGPSGGANPGGYASGAVGGGGMVGLTHGNGNGNGSQLVLLPEHVLAQVFGYVGVGGLVACAMRVCSAWTALYRVASLWRHLWLPKYAVVLPYLPRNCLRDLVLEAPLADRRQDAIDACRLLNRYGQHHVRSITLMGHGIDTALMEFFARILTPNVTQIRFDHVGLSFERKLFLNVMQQATHLSSLHITRRPFRRATILSPLLSLFSTSLTHLRLDNLAADQIPNIGALVPNLVSLELDGLIEVVFWANSPAALAAIGLDPSLISTSAAPDINDRHHSSATTAITSNTTIPTSASASSIPTSSSSSSSLYFAIMPNLKHLRITNVEYTEDCDEAISKLMTFMVARTPVLDDLVFSCQNYLIDIWQCAEFWANIKTFEAANCLVTSDFLSVLYQGLLQLQNHHLSKTGYFPNHILRLRLKDCEIEDAHLAQQLFGEYLTVVSTTPTA
ncbi:hypothetical protein HK100_004281 [Physocladia obscura]|uniref:F-box domain-containing protein n=1 Tax=Physocladia obscura TaxID=109957 RepID=A0AAD5X8V2_9FUNG|nr:hypothetical protein HK100_004281 [Physocladia obscura]